MKKFIFGLLLLMCSLSINAGSYTVSRGQTLTLKCTASAPAGGWITHAFFNLVNPEDAEYIGINYTSSNCYATIYGLKAASRIPIEVTYAYSYRGTYDNNIHVGHGSYTDYITVSGPRSASSFKFKEGNDISVPSNGSIIIHVEFYPSGSVPDAFNCGFINNFGQPFSFDAAMVSPSSYDIKITGKGKVGNYVYFMAHINNDTKTAQTTKLTIRDAATTIAPTTLIISPETMTLMEGKSETISVKYEPENAWIDPTFTSLNTKIATVDETGKITAVSAGTTQINVQAGTLKKTCKVIVEPKPTGFNVKSDINITAGFSYNIEPEAIPSGSKASFKLTSSDTNIITVSGNKITGIRPGTAIITVKCIESNTEKEVEVTICSPNDEFDVRRATQRVQTIKNLFYKSLSK